VPRPFFHTTAEDVIASTEAVIVNGKPTSATFVSQFLDIPLDRVENALKFAVELEFLSFNAGHYSAHGPLSQLLSTPKLMQKAAVLRVALESYEPFTMFRTRLKATDFASQAAQQTKVALDLDGHRDVVKDTLINLGTYSHALDTEGGGLYVPSNDSLENRLLSLAQACGDLISAEGRVNVQLGDAAVALISRNDVILPLANALLKAASGDARGAVVLAGNAVESYLTALAGRLGVPNAVGAPGVNAKLVHFATANAIPSKLVAVGKYLGNVRNAADHGVDAEVGAAWTIQESTGTEFVFVACSFVNAVTAREQGQPPKI
jgi:hypothetical protein